MYIKAKWVFGVKSFWDYQSGQGCFLKVFLIVPKARKHSRRVGIWNWIAVGFLKRLLVSVLFHVESIYARYLSVSEVICSQLQHVSEGVYALPRSSFKMRSASVNCRSRSIYLNLPKRKESLEKWENVTFSWFSQVLFFSVNWDNIQYTERKEGLEIEKILIFLV